MTSSRSPRRSCDRGAAAARPVEDRRRVDVPAQHTDPRTPETVTGAAPGWVPVDGRGDERPLRAQARAARTQAAPARAAIGHAWPTLPGRASCADGPRWQRAARNRGRARAPARGRARAGDRLDGRLGSPANDRAPAASGRQGGRRRRGRRPRARSRRGSPPRTGATTARGGRQRCSFPGCTDAPIPRRQASMRRCDRFWQGAPHAGAVHPLRAQRSAAAPRPWR